ncbi:hypothetical protein DIPPA_34600, partial [Diplonema papillatum]
MDHDPRDGDLEALQSEAVRLEARHNETLKHMDAMLAELRRSERELVELMNRRSVSKSGDLVQELATLDIEELENLLGAKECEVRVLQIELESHNSEVAALSSENRQLQLELHVAEASAARMEKRLEDDKTLSGGLQRFSETLDLQAEREMRLRNLEDKVIDADELADRQSKALEKLRQEHATLTELKQKSCRSAEEELNESKKVSETMGRTLEKLNERLELARKRSAMSHKKVSELQADHERLEGERDHLTAELRRIQSEKGAQVTELDSTVDKLLGAHGSDTRLENLEDVMLILKAIAINLAEDVAFINSVHEKYSECEEHTSVTRRTIGTANPVQALSGFIAGYTYVRQYVTSIHGAQREGDAWILEPDVEPTYDEVETLYTALKQLAICYDMMPTTKKREIPMARELIRNSTNLNNLAAVCAMKHRELVAERERREAVLIRERDERIK